MNLTKSAAHRTTPLDLFESVIDRLSKSKDICDKNGGKNILCARQLDIWPFVSTNFSPPPHAGLTSNMVADVMNNRIPAMRPWSVIDYQRALG